MARLSTLLLGLLGSSLILPAAAQKPDGMSWEDYSKYQNQISTCLNNWFTKSFAPTCSNDPACHCNQTERRKLWFCGMMNNCLNLNVMSRDYVLDYIKHIHHTCEPGEHNRPYEYVDPYVLCGLTAPASSTSTTAATSPTVAATTTNAASDTSVTAASTSQSSTVSSSTVPSTSTNGTAVSSTTPGAAATTSPATGAAGTVNGAAALSGLGVLVAGSALLLL